MRRTAIAFFTTTLLLAAGAAGADALDAQGRLLLSELGCKACHPFEGQGGQMAPSLDDVGRRLSAEEIRRLLRDPKSRNPESIMPSYDYLTKEKLGTLVEFLSRQKGR